MGTRLILLSALSGILFSSGCTTLKRYSSMTDSGINNNIADIDLFGKKLTVPSPAENSKNLWDLSAEAQSQFIKILNQRYPDNEMFLKSISYEYLKHRDAAGADNYTDKDLRMIFSVSKERNYSQKDSVSGIVMTPADRIEYLRISLKMAEDSILRFTGWNMYATEFGSIDIAGMSFSRSLALNSSSGVSGKPPSLEDEVSAGIGSSLSRKEDQTIKYRYLKLNGKINDSVMVMEEEGTRETDLTGNIIADVSLSFNQFPGTLTRITGFKDSLGSFNDPDQLSMDHLLVYVPLIEEIKDTIYADLQMDYIYRNVIRGSKTFPEWDDRVKYYSGKVNKRIPLFTAYDYVPDFYCIGFPGGAGKKDLVKFKSPGNKEMELIFRTRSEASDFHEWLIQFFSNTDNKEKVVMIGGHALTFRNNYLGSSHIAGSNSIQVLPRYY